jgi:hypothetical protein
MTKQTWIIHTPPVGSIGINEKKKREKRLTNEKRKRIFQKGKNNGRGLNPSR